MQRLVRASTATIVAIISGSPAMKNDWVPVITMCAQGKAIAKMRENRNRSPARGNLSPECLRQSACLPYGQQESPPCTPPGAGSMPVPPPLPPLPRSAPRLMPSAFFCPLLPFQIRNPVSARASAGPGVAAKAPRLRVPSSSADDLLYAFCTWPAAALTNSGLSLSLSLSHPCLTAADAPPALMVFWRLVSFFDSPSPSPDQSLNPAAPSFSSQHLPQLRCSIQNALRSSAPSCCGSAIGCSPVPSALPRCSYAVPKPLPAPPLQRSHVTPAALSCCELLCFTKLRSDRSFALPLPFFHHCVIVHAG
ncbi:hypothetical protein ANO11243_089020 [Dothideomycetidae sp. 11243]|nr:hypothetical protein ANO11243_089020 [fungal sp. No.11243]